MVHEWLVVLLYMATDFVSTLRGMPCRLLCFGMKIVTFHTFLVYCIPVCEHWKQKENRRQKLSSANHCCNL